MDRLAPSEFSLEFHGLGLTDSMLTGIDRMAISLTGYVAFIFSDLFFYFSFSIAIFCLHLR